MYRSQPQISWELSSISFFLFFFVTVISVAASGKGSKSSKKTEKSSKQSHSKKKDSKKSAVLTEATSQNTHVHHQKHGEGKAFKLQLGQHSPKLLLSKPGSDKKLLVEKKLVTEKKPGVTQDSKLTAKSIGISSPVVGGKTPASQGSSILPKNLQGAEPANTPTVVTVQGIKIGPKVQAVSSSQKDGTITSRQMNVGTLLPPTPPNEPVLIPPLTQVVPTQRLQLILPTCQQVVAAPPNPVIPVTRFCSPTIRIVNPMSTQLLTPRPPHLVVDKPVASISPLKIPEKPPSPKPVEKPLNKPVGQPLDKPVGHPLDKPVGQPLDKPVGQPLDKPVGHPLDKPVGQPLDKPVGILWTSQWGSLWTSQWGSLL